MSESFLYLYNTTYIVSFCLYKVEDYIIEKLFNIKQMKQFSQQYSPIQSKNPHNHHCCEQLLQKIDNKDISNISHNHHTLSQPFNYSNIEHKLITTAKTLVYLFSPEIDLLQTLQNKVEHYDKFQRTKLILKQLVNSIYCRFQRDIDVMKTQQEISKISIEFENLKSIAEILQKENEKKNMEVQKLKQTIIKLTRAYEEARLCFQQEIMEINFQCDHLRSKLKSQTWELSKQKKYNDDHSINLKVPKEKRRKDSHKYTDRKMFVRFSASQIQQNDNVVTSISKDEDLGRCKSQNNSCSHIIVLNHLEAQKEVLQRKIQILEQELRKVREENIKQENKLKAKREQMEKTNQIYEKQLRLRQFKIIQKNKLINQLLSIMQKQ